MYYFLIIIFCLILSNKCNAESEDALLNNKLFYIKNAYTGHYLDVAGGIAKGGTNVQQYEFNGSDAQKWYIEHQGNGIYVICSMVGATYTGNTAQVHYALDVDNGINQNGTQIHIWDLAKGDTQRFTFSETPNGTYVIYTKCSNNEKVVSLSNNLCNNGVNIHQWEHSYHCHDQWIMEPVYLDSEMAVKYAKRNYNKTLLPYPDLQDFGGNCTNFVSQCLLAGGWHQDNNWYVKKKNMDNERVMNVEQLNSSWNLADPSPWISAKQFKKKFIDSKNTQKFKGSQILENPSKIYQLSYFKGDVIQIAENVLGIGILGDAKHSMIITDYNYNGDNSSFKMTYQSANTLNKDLLEIANKYKNDFFIFYDFTE